MTYQFRSKAPITLPNGILSPTALPVWRYGSKDLLMIPKYLFTRIQVALDLLK